MVFTQGRGFVVGKSFGWSRQSLPSHDLTELNSRLFRDRNLNVAAVLLIVSAVPWLVPWHWRSAVVGIATVVTALSLYLRPTAARLLLPVLVGVSFVIFFIAGLHRDGIDIGDRPYVGMQLLTPLSIIALVLFRRSRHYSTPTQD